MTVTYLSRKDHPLTIRILAALTEGRSVPGLTRSGRTACCRCSLR